VEKTEFSIPGFFCIWSTDLNIAQPEQGGLPFCFLGSLILSQTISYRIGRQMGRALGTLVVVILLTALVYVGAPTPRPCPSESTTAARCWSS